MIWQVSWTGPATRDMRRLDRPIARRIRDAVIGLAETGQGNIQHLHGELSDQMRLRVDDWRVRFEYDRSERRIVVLRVLPRGKAYR